MTVVEIISTILQQNNLDIAGLSKSTGIGLGPLYKMARGETKRISYQSAKRISSAFPQYSIDFLRNLDKVDKEVGIEYSKKDKSMEDLLADRVIQKLTPLIQSISKNSEVNASLLELLQHLILDVDEMKDNLEVMEKQMNKITKLHK